MSTFPNHLHAKLPFLMDDGLLRISPACCDQLVKILIALEPNGIFGILVYFSINCSATVIQNGEEGLPSIILAS